MQKSISNVCDNDTHFQLNLINNTGNGFDATASFFSDINCKTSLDVLHVTLGAGSPLYKWEKSHFTPSEQEYFEFQVQNKIDHNLIWLEQQEINS